ncbi:hypothetical protein OAF54_02240 [bacterium]|nr:hypothetical protein [bacterium]
MSRDRTRIIVDGVTVIVLKNGSTTLTDYNNEIEAYEAAKALIDIEISEAGE